MADKLKRFVLACVQDIGRFDTRAEAMEEMASYEPTDQVTYVVVDTTGGTGESAKGVVEPEPSPRVRGAPSRDHRLRVAKRAGRAAKKRTGRK